MNTKQVIERLKKEATTNPVFNSVAHVFALRERARNMVSVRALEQRMEREGFRHDRAEYEKILNLLSEVGFGRLERNRRGKVSALKDIKITLQSLGRAVCSDKPVPLTSMKTRNRYSAVESSEEDTKVKQPPTPSSSSSPSRRRASDNAKVVLTFIINNKAINVQVPPDLTSQEVALLIGKFQSPEA